ncbi:rod shape determining protein RodA [Candidatus Thermokryptus mobilis]|uniref:Peptidoglycan glycosyltransferase RodA n=1 Tax=Candidatus Thermokryptus mobilis TaxID=1643428 RepID=A0A0S4N2C2_9BACT|nr:rod shape-determining protein RodA [Candidatus Thermokryptus mobilis]CUU04326.1 rod shape determining protein RodA [Candidatus Thermokryptus mobilis]
MERGIADKIDFKILIPFLGLVLISLLSVYSATNLPGQYSIFVKHVLWIFSGLLVALFFYFFPVQKLIRLSVWLYILSTIFLVIVLFIGKKTSGSESWIQIGRFQFQPSEFAKFTTILILAYFLSRRNVEPDRIITLIVSAVLTLIPIFLVILQPDLGTAIVFGGIFIGMLFWAGVPVFWLLLIVAPMIVILASFLSVKIFIITLILTTLVFILMRRSLILTFLVIALNLMVGLTSEHIYHKVLKPHQQKRIATFLNPSSDPLGAGYNVIQSKIAIGSGGLTGKGFLKGTQTQLRFVPAQWTDFIFCVPAEEFGFIGSAIILILYFILLWRILNLASILKQRFASLVAIGIFSTWTFHVVVNIGMTLGLSPVIGIWLPFLSYGGSAMWMNMAMVGLLLNFYANRRELF